MTMGWRWAWATYREYRKLVMDGRKSGQEMDIPVNPELGASRWPSLSMASRWDRQWGEVVIIQEGMGG